MSDVVSLFFALAAIVSRGADGFPPPESFTEGLSRSAPLVRETAIGRWWRCDSPEGEETCWAGLVWSPDGSPDGRPGGVWVLETGP